MRLFPPRLSQQPLTVNKTGSLLSPTSMTCIGPFIAHRQSARPGAAADDAAVSGRADGVDERLSRDGNVQAQLQLPCRVRAGLLRARLLGDLSGARRQVRSLHVQRERHARLSRRLDGIVLRQRWVSIL